MTSKISRFREALREQYNVIGLAGAAALSAALLNPIPLLVGVAAEAAYLLFVPDSKWYESRLSRRFDAEVIARREALKAEVFAVVPDTIKRRFARLETIRAQVEAQPGMDARWFREVVRKLDYLLEKFLLFARKDTEFRTYLESVVDEDENIGFVIVKGGKRVNGPRIDISEGRARESGQAMVHLLQTRFERQIAQVQDEVSHEEDLNTQAVLEKRITVLEQRRDYFGKIGRILTNLGHQMELLEDSFGLINDQLRARSPEQVLADIEGVVSQTESMTTLLEEFAPFEHM